MKERLMDRVAQHEEMENEGENAPPQKQGTPISLRVLRWRILMYKVKKECFNPYVKLMVEDIAAIIDTERNFILAVDSFEREVKMLQRGEHYEKWQTELAEMRSGLFRRWVLIDKNIFRSRVLHNYVNRLPFKYVADSQAILHRIPTCYRVPTLDFKATIYSY